MAVLDLDADTLPLGATALRTARLLSWLLVPLCLLATAIGLFVPNFYADAPTWVLQAHAQDLVTLVVVIPLLAGSLVLVERGSVRGYLLWIGTLGYLIYSYAIYAFDVRLNFLFLAYVSILGLSIYSLVLGLTSVAPRVVARCFQATTLISVIGWFLIVVCGLAAVLWLSDEVPAMIGGGVPASMVGTGLVTNPVHVLDLAIVLPGGIFTGLLLLRREALGFVLGGYYLVKFATLGLGIQAINLFMLIAGQPIDAGPAVTFAIITASSVVLGWLFLASVHRVVLVSAAFKGSRLAVHLSATLNPPEETARRH